MKKVLVRFFLVSLFVASVIVLISSISMMNNNLNNKRISDDYYSKCTFIYKTSGGLYLREKGDEPYFYSNNDTVSYFIITFINQSLKTPVVKDIKEIKPQDTLRLERAGILLNGFGRESYSLSYELLRQSNGILAVPDSLVGDLFVDQGGAYRAYYHYKNHLEEIKDENSSFDNIILAVVSFFIIALLLVFGLIEILKAKVVWVGNNEYKNYVLKRTKIRRRYFLLFYPDECFSVFKTWDLNNDGVADYKEKLWFAFRSVSKKEVLLTDKDKEIYSYVLKCFNNAGG